MKNCYYIVYKLTLLHPSNKIVTEGHIYHTNLDLDEWTHLLKFINEMDKRYKGFTILSYKKLKDTKTDEIECPKCQRMFHPPEVCECGYEHQCGGPNEACEIPGCPECGAK